MKLISRYNNIKIKLLESIASGGEGEVFTITKSDELVAKIYHENQRTAQREQKLIRLIEKKIPFEESFKKGIVLPFDILYDKQGKFFGYIMPKVQAYPLRLALFSKSRVQRYFPTLNRVQLASFAIAFLEQIEYLHEKNILIGDINPLNLLIDRDNPSKCWLIDTDSFQVDEFACPVGTDLFTPARLQGSDFKTTLRSKEDEYFSMMIMVFMILMLGKHPYAKVGGESPAKNILKNDFPYPKNYGKMNEVPKGVWGFIWSHFNVQVKEMFYECFANENCCDTTEAIKQLVKYRNLVTKELFAKELYPQNYHTKNPQNVTCEICSQTFVIDANWFKKLKLQGKKPRCAQCQQKIMASILAHQSRKREKQRKKVGFIV
jgi:DNA-binding helix-hairpin-helix protein with protein kinase domain